MTLSGAILDFEHNRIDEYSFSWLIQRIYTHAPKAAIEPSQNPTSVRLGVILEIYNTSQHILELRFEPITEVHPIVMGIRIERLV
jgi:hypothetical protein